MIFLVAVTVIATFFFLRTCLILLGLIKEPLLEVFAEYGPVEKVYLVGLPLIVWLGIMMFIGGLWVAGQFNGMAFTMNTMGILMIFVGALGYNYYETATKYHLKILRFPRWYHELRERTSRYERRRIAYMWLHLPRGLRVTYSSSDKLFLQWADFVIMGTIREEEDTLKPTHEEKYVFHKDWM